MSDNKFNQEHFSETSLDPNKQDDTEDYTFIKETIRPKKKSKLKKFAFTIALGVTFGGVACLTFCVFYPTLSKVFGVENDQVIINSDNPNVSVSVTPTQSPIPNVAPSDSANPDATTSPDATVSPSKGTATPDMSYASILTQIEKVQRVVGPSIVSVNSVVTGIDILDNPNEENYFTSGIIIHKDSTKILIMTNCDVVDKATYITITMSSDVTYKATLYGVNHQIGIALVSVDLEQMDNRVIDNLVVAEMGDSTVAKVGQSVIAMGNPNGYMYSVDYGVVSSKQVDAYFIDGKVQLLNTTIAHNDNGNGFILDRKGRILGVITHIENFKKDLNANLNTSLSMSSIRPMIQRLINRQETMYMGIEGSDIDSKVAAKLGISQGIYITKVEENSPAFLAGVKKGDVLTGLDGAQTNSMILFYNQLNSLSKGKKVKLELKRRKDGVWSDFIEWAEVSVTK